MLDADGHTNFPPFQGARPDHVRVESLSSCFPGKLVSLWFFDLESVFQTKQATSCAHLETTVYSLLATGSRNPESSPRVVYSTNSIASTTAIIRPSPATSTAIATKTQSVSNPSRVPGNGRQDASCMETNRLSTLEMVLMAVCGGLTAVVIGLAARLCILRKRRRTRFVSFFFSVTFLNVFFLHKPGLLVHGWLSNETGVTFFCPRQDRFLSMDLYLTGPRNFFPNSPVCLSCYM